MCGRGLSVDFVKETSTKTRIIIWNNKAVPMSQEAIITFPRGLGVLSSFFAEFSETLGAPVRGLDLIHNWDSGFNREQLKLTNRF
jgi:hypothetical protein